MKKGIIKLSGIISIIVSILFLFISVFMIGTVYNISFLSNILNSTFIGNIYNVVVFIFVSPIVYIFTIIGLDIYIANQIFSVLVPLITILTLIEGIREIVISKKSDEDFLSTKKTTYFFNFFRFFFIFIIVYLIVASFVFEDVSSIYNQVTELVGIPFFSQIAVVLALILNLACSISVIKSYKSKDENLSSDEQQQNQNIQNSLYQEQGYINNQTQPIDPSVFVGVQDEKPSNPYNLVPGQNGIPINITEKGLEDLARLERLKISGSIDEKNYYVLREKICRNNLSN